MFVVTKMIVLWGKFKYVFLSVFENLKTALRFQFLFSASIMYQSHHHIFVGVFY